jgi:hypothetical protein
MDSDAMNLRQLAATLLAVTIVTAGAAGAVAAAPGNAPDDAGSQSDDAQDDDHPDDADADAMNEHAEADRANASDRATEGPDGNASVPAGSAGERGPPSELPGQVPAHVGEIHSSISSYLDGSIDDLGQALADVTPGEDTEDADADEESDAADSGNGTATATADA